MKENVNKLRVFEQYNDMINRLYPLENYEPDIDYLSRTVTFQVTDNCNLQCKYCYQINKGLRKMSYETGKKFIDLLLSGDKGFNDYINPKNSPGIIIEFIGGEPFLEVDLIDKLVDYFKIRAIELQHPWATKYCISVCSNGTLYSDERVQRFLEKNKNNISFSVTIDGNKELHDSCRIFPDGNGSYDLAVAAAQDWMKRGFYMGSKITIAPANLDYLFDAIVHMVELGYEDINANCVYEKGWDFSLATKFYYQLKKIADYFIDNDLVEDIYLSLFSEAFFKPMAESDNKNWCGSTFAMISCDPDGKIYPCIRYMESSLGTDQKPLVIGDVDNGLAQRECEKDCLHCLNNITRRSQSTDECFYCPIAQGCSWCSAYNYQVNGTVDKRVTYICCMHKARALANVYYWNKYYIKNGIDKVFDCNCPEEWALDIIPQDEYNMLIGLTNRSEKI